MYTTNLDFRDNSYIDINVLSKEFNAVDFAKSLLPESDNYKSEETFYGDFLEDLEKKVESGQIPSVTTNNFDCFRTWSNMKFKQKQLPLIKKKTITENSPNIPEPEVVRDSTEVPMVRNDGRNITSILNNFLNEEKKSKVLISNLKFNHYYVDLPLIQSADKEFFRFYYLDAYEKLFGEEQTVYLFGKTYCHHCESYKSCCVVVTPLQRKLFVLPKQCITDENGENIPEGAISVLKEFYNLALKPLNIKNFNYRFVKKKVVEESLFPVEEMLLEIEYSAHYPAINNKLQGSTFSKVFGAKNNCLENFLLDKFIRGPCWLDVFNPKKAIKEKTWCSFEVSCSIEDILLCERINNSASPPLKIFSFHMRSVTQKSNIALMSWAVNFNYEIWKENSTIIEEQTYCALTFVSSNVDAFELPQITNGLRRTKIQKMISEKDMLMFFLTEFNKIDPDIVVGYDIENKDFHMFIDRLESLQIEDCNKLGKFKVLSANSDLRRFLFSGRLLCDLRYLAKEFSLSRNYELNELYEKFLNINEEQRWLPELDEIFLSTEEFKTEEFLGILVISITEPLYLLKLVSKANIIPLSVKLTQICGNVLSQTFNAGITERCQYLLLHKFHEHNFLPPNKKYKKNKKDIEEDELLLGGLVLEPKLGFYNNYILLMDFESLYPSIIHEYNICISHNADDHSNSTDLPSGILPKLMGNFVQERRIVKDKMKSLNIGTPTFYRYEIYQTALKLSANSIYGCLGHHNFRFYAPSVAQKITEHGRQILSNTFSLLENEGFDIIYGDTDSLMVNTNSLDLGHVREVGRRIEEMVNANFSSIHLRIDSIFKKLLMIAKKKYAGIAVDHNNDVRILKGLDIIRYDWPDCVCEIGKIVVDIILNDNTLREKHEKIKEVLRQTKIKLLNNDIPIETLVMTKYLTQDPLSYSEETKLPHVQVALRCNKKCLFDFKSGDAVSFVMCCDKQGTFSKKAYHLKELKSMNDLVIDGSYYLHKQVLPFVSKICSFIALSNWEIEQCLGKENRPPKNKQLKTNEKKFERRNPFIFNCQKCGELNTLDANDNQEILDKCQNVECDFCPFDNLSYLENRLVLTINGYIQKYYKCELKCTNVNCTVRKFRIPLSYSKEKNSCTVCSKGAMVQVFNECDLFLQLAYFKYIFSSALCSTFNEKKKVAFKSLLESLHYYEKHSGFLSVNITDLFNNL